MYKYNTLYSSTAYSQAHCSEIAAWHPEGGNKKLWRTLITRGGLRTNLHYLWRLLPELWANTNTILFPHKNTYSKQNEQPADYLISIALKSNNYPISNFSYNWKKGIYHQKQNLSSVI